MHPLSIILAFAILGVIVAVGALLFSIGLRRLRSGYVPNPSSQRGGVQRMKPRWTVLLTLFLMGVGTFLVVKGVWGAYNLVWAS